MLGKVGGHERGGLFVAHIDVAICSAACELMKLLPSSTIPEGVGRVPGKLTVLFTALLWASLTIPLPPSRLKNH